LKIAHELKDSDVSFLDRNLETKNASRGFEGGEIGLKWLKKQKKKHGLLMGTEVANAAHVILVNMILMCCG
jgi:chorismate mutase